MSSLLDRITINPSICHGKPTIRGLRYPVELLLWGSPKITDRSIGVTP
jgi:uncharacterized protein (DUF433 family)